MAPKLSHSTFGEEGTCRPSSFKREMSQIVSEVTLARDLYSTSVNDLATTLCFLKLQEMGF